MCLRDLYNFLKKKSSAVPLCVPVCIRGENLVANLISMLTNDKLNFMIR